MAGFAALIGGVGDAAGKYGQQVRGLLEERRHAFADMLGKAASEESDPQHRAELLRHQADLLSGEPLGKTASGLLKTLQGRQEDNKALAQALGGPQQQAQPKPQPGPAAPGQTPGTAAQPSTSPVQPQAQAQPQAMGGFSRTPMIPLVPGGMGGIGEYSPPPIPAPAQAQPAMAGMISQPSPVSPAQPSANVATPSASVSTPSASVMSDIPGMGMPAIQDSQAIMRKYMGDPGWQAPANRPALQAAMVQELQHNEALKQAVEQQQFTLSTGMQRLNLLGHPQVKARVDALVQQGMPQEIAEMTVASALGIQMPFMGAMMRSMMIPNRMELTADQVIRSWPAEAKIAGIQPGGHPVQVLLSRIDGRPTQLGEHPFPDRFVQAQDAQGNPMMMSLSPYQSQGALPSVGGLTPMPPSQLTPRTFPTAAGGVEQTSPAQIRAGAAPTQVPGAVSPPMLPTETQRLITTNDPVTGQPIQQFEPVTSRKIPPVASGAPAALPPANRTFSKPLTPLQQLTEEQKLQQYDLAIGRINSIKGNLHLLDSMIDAGKLQLEMDSSGILRSIVNRAIPLTPAEAQFVGNFITVTEDINLLRGPLGATGFRGPEAFARLQAQRGQLLAHPEITRQVLDNTLKAMEAQRQPLIKGLHQPNQAAPQAGVPDEVQKLLSGVGAGTYTLSDNSVWIKGADGSMTKK